ncbi:transcription factor HHO2-like [Curcuma longa]|uniref:transcription factor HHO2-like n=1 Tax=Curcuma longa TaxID=136217 RepID=UPI003D9E1DB4
MIRSDRSLALYQKRFGFFFLLFLRDDPTPIPRFLSPLLRSFLGFQATHRRPDRRRGFAQIEMEMVERGQRFRHDYIRALEEERKKIEVFQRELPLCLQLVTQAIESVEEQMCEEERSAVSGNEPVLAEFIPLKPSLASTAEEEVERGKQAARGFDAKPDWLRSVHLWNQCADTGPRVEPPVKPIAVSLKKTGGAFQPFEREKHAAPPPVVSTAAAASSTTSASGSRGCGGNGSTRGDKEKERQSQTNRKTRRCWSPELHHRFVDALQLLGGAHVATPKQIRELMKVDGLTNDEVKSHLQKYRLHNRRSGTAAQSNSSTSSTAAPQIVLVGGILVPPPPPAITGGSCAPPGGVYAPVARHPLESRSPKQQQATEVLPRSCSRDGDDCSDDDEVTKSASLTASATSQTTIASPSF